MDFINVMMYDFHGEWEDTVNVHSSLYSNDELSVVINVNLIIEMNCIFVY